MPSSPFLGLPGVICGISNDSNFKQLAFGMTDLGNGLGALAVNVSTTNDFPYDGTDGQTLKTASFLGIGGLDNTNKFSPVDIAADGSLVVSLSSPVLGQAAMASSLPVVIASNQTAVPSNISQIAGTTITGGAYSSTMNGNRGNTDTGLLTVSQIYAQRAGGTTVNSLQMDSYAVSPLWTTSGGSTTATVATGTGNTVIKGTPGRLCRVVITTAGTTGNATIYDNATTNSGTVLAVIPGTTGNSSAAIGDVFVLDMPAAAGITAANVTNGPAFTVSYW